MKTIACIWTLFLPVCGVLTSVSVAQPPPMRFGNATQLPGPINDEDRIDFAMDISHDGREMYYTSTSSWSTWVAQRDNIGEEFGEPEWVTRGEHPSLSPDGMTLFVDDIGEFGQEDLFQLHRTSLDAPWSDPENIGEAVNSTDREWGANISPDGKTLYFLRNNGNPADSRIWQSKRDDVTQPFGEATRLEGRMANVNAYGVEVSEDNLKLFYSAAAGDLYVVSRQSEDADWSKPQFLSREVNSPYAEFTTSLSADERTLYFDRLAPGGATFEGPYNIWQVPILPSGDFDGNWQLDAADVDALASAIRAGNDPIDFDVDGQGTVDDNDLRIWVHDIRGTWLGDANLDVEFNSGDLVAVFETGQYEDGVAASSTWATGDWNGDAEFNTSDLVLAFQDGGYEQGPQSAAQAVPEPTSLLSILVALSTALVTNRGGEKRRLRHR